MNAIARIDFLILELFQFVCHAIIPGKFKPCLNNIIISLKCTIGDGYN